MRLQYLGTGAAEGWPGLFCPCDSCETARRLGGRNLRTRSQTVVYGGTNQEDVLLIELPPDTYHHCLTHGFRLDRVAHLLVTHSHHDHFTPDELQYRMEWYTTLRNAPLHIYGNEAVHDELARMLEKENLTEEQLGIIFHTPTYFTPFQAGRFTVTPLKAEHKPSEHCMLYLIAYEGRQILYAHDTGLFPEETWAYLSGKHLDLVSLDCTYGTGPGEGSHMNLTQCAETKKRLASINCIDEASRVVLNHFSHNGKLHYDAMLEAAAPHGMAVSFDGAVWDIL